MTTWGSEMRLTVEGATPGTTTVVTGTPRGHLIVEEAHRDLGPLVLADGPARQLNGGDAERVASWSNNDGTAIAEVIAYVRYEQGEVAWSPANILQWQVWAESRKADRVLLASGTITGNNTGKAVSGGVVVFGAGAAETLALEVKEIGDPQAAGRAGGRLVAARRP